jgi:hypothetical protein
MHGRRVLGQAAVLLAAMAAGAVVFQAPRAFACSCVDFLPESLPLTLAASWVDGVAQPLPSPPPLTGLRVAIPASPSRPLTLQGALYDPRSPELRCPAIEAQR